MKLPAFILIFVLREQENASITLQAQDSSRLGIQSLQYRSQGPLGKDYFRTTIFFPANFVTLLAVIWLDGEHYFSAGMYTPNNIKL